VLALSQLPVGVAVAMLMTAGTLAAAEWDVDGDPANAPVCLFDLAVVRGEAPYDSARSAPAYTNVPDHAAFASSSEMSHRAMPRSASTEQASGGPSCAAGWSALAVLRE
jgi:hypothetical protein